MADIIVAGLIGIILGVAVLKLFIDRKNGVVCSGCPQGEKGISGCHSINKSEK
jgi:hypothetical protein